MNIGTEAVVANQLETSEQYSLPLHQPLSPSNNSNPQIDRPRPHRPPPAVPVWWTDLVKRQTRIQAKREQEALQGVEYINGQRYEWQPGTVDLLGHASSSSRLKPTPNYFEALNSDVPDTIYPLP